MEDNTLDKLLEIITNVEEGTRYTLFSSNGDEMVFESFRMDHDHDMVYYFFVLNGLVEYTVVFDMNGNFVFTGVYYRRGEGYDNNKVAEDEIIHEEKTSRIFYPFVFPEEIKEPSGEE